MMHLLSAFAAFSMISGAITALLPEGAIRRTTSMVIGLMMLCFWANGIEQLLQSLPDPGGIPASALTSTGLILEGSSASPTQEATP